MGETAEFRECNWEEEVEQILWTAFDIEKRVAELGASISKDYKNRPLAIVGVATGAVIFLADLVRQIKIPASVDLVRVRSYRNQTQSSGVATLTTDVCIDVKDKDVLLVEDIIDTGISLSTLVSHFTEKDAASVSVCAFLDKVARRRVPLQLADGCKFYRGFECPDEFVIGYGMDYDEKFRTLPYIGVLRREAYNS